MSTLWRAQNGRMLLLGLRRGNDMAGEKDQSKPTKAETAANLLRLGQLLHQYAYPIGDLGLTRPIKPEEAERLKVEIEVTEKRIEEAVHDMRQWLLRGMLGLRGREVVDPLVVRIVAVVAWLALASERPDASVARVANTVAEKDMALHLEARKTIRLMVARQTAIRYQESDISGGGLILGSRTVQYLSGEGNLPVVWSEESLKAEKAECENRKNGALLRRLPLASSVENRLPADAPETRTPLAGSQSPKAIFEALRQTVIGMEDTDTLRRFSVAMSLHMRRANLVRQNIVPTTPCQTLCIAGESGVGKTFMVEEFCKIANLPYTIGSLAEVTSSGYAGMDLTDTLTGFFRNGAKHSEVEAGGIVFWDEADKRKRHEQHGDYDCVGEGLQGEMLRIIEGTDIQLGGRKANDPVKGMLSTRGFAFCLVGCFDGLMQAMAKSRRKGPIGFNHGFDDVNRSPDIREALTSFFLPELCNRISTILYIRPPSLSALIQIVTSPRGVLAKQNHFLRELGLTLKPGADAIREICSYAHSSKTYARGVRSLFQALAEDAIFEEWKGELVIGPGEVQKAIEGMSSGARVAEK